MASPQYTDQQYQQQIEYWKTHEAKTAPEVQQKVEAYQYAVAHGIKGAQFLNENEVNVNKTGFGSAGPAPSPTGGPASAAPAAAAAAPTTAMHKLGIGTQLKTIGDNGRAADPFSGSLPHAAAGARAGYDAATNQLVQSLNGIKDVPQQSYVGDANADPAALARQNAALDQLQGQTSVQETPEEKLMRYMAQGKQEQQEKSTRLANEAQLRSQGMLGSGGQIASMLGSAQNTGQERTMSELGAQANAQQRAMQALANYNTATGTARTQSTNESQFNQNMKKGFNDTNTGIQQQNQANQISRAGQIAQAQVGNTQAKYGTTQDVQNTDTSLTGKVATNNSNTAGSVGTAGQNTAGALGDAGNVKLNADGTLKRAADAASPGP
jgi:hypothetical protein